MPKTKFAVLALLLAIVARPDTLSAQQKQRGDRNRISKDDMAEVLASVNTAFDVVRTLRPQWLNPPALRQSTATVMGDGGGATDVVVYVDDLRQQSKDDLKTVKATTILEIKYLDQHVQFRCVGRGTRWA